MHVIHKICHENLCKAYAKMAFFAKNVSGHVILAQIYFVISEISSIFAHRILN